MRLYFAVITALTATAAIAFADDGDPSLGLSSAAQVTFTSSYRLNQMLGQTAEGQWRTGEATNGLTVRRTLKGTALELSLVHRRYHGHAGYVGADGLVASLRPTDPTTTMSLWVGPAHRRVRARAWWRVGSEHGNDGGVGCTWSPSHRLRIGVEYASQHAFPFTTALWYEGEGGHLRWLSEMSLWRYHLHWTPDARWQVFACAAVYDFPAERSESDVPSAVDYLAVVEGVCRDGTFGVTVAPADRLAIYGRFRSITGDMRLQVYSNGRRFAHFGLAAFEVRMWSVGVNRFGADACVRWGRAEGDLAGTMEAWPFISGLARLIGERRHFVGDASARWMDVSLVDTIAVSKWISLPAALRYVRVEPDMRYATWRPIAFGMGVDDLESERLDIENAHLMHVNLSPSVKSGSWQLAVTVGQWIPLNVQKRADASNGGEGSVSDGSGSLSSDSEESTRHHGFSFSVSVACSL